MGSHPFVQAVCRTEMSARTLLWNLHERVQDDFVLLVLLALLVAAALVVVCSIENCASRVSAESKDLSQYQSPMYQPLQNPRPLRAARL